MPDFIYARGTFYTITAESHAVYICDAEEATFSFSKADYPDQAHIDGVTICHQAEDTFLQEKFREWIKSAP